MMASNFLLLSTVIMICGYQWDEVHMQYMELSV